MNISRRPSSVPLYYKTLSDRPLHRPLLNHAKTCVRAFFGVAAAGIGLIAQAQQKPASIAARNAASKSPGASLPRSASATPPNPLPATQAAHAVGPAIELRMKFKAGEISKYQMTERTNIVLPGQAPATTTNYDTNISLVIQQRVNKLNPDGSAEIAITTLSGAGAVNGQYLKPDVGGKPALITFDTRNNIVTAKDLPPGADAADVTSKLFQSGALSTQGVYLPKQPVRIGDRWTQKINISSLSSGGGGTVQTTFVRMEPVGLYQTARLHSLMRVPFMIVDTTSKTPVPLKGMLNMAYDSNLAVGEGKVVRSTGMGDITVVVDMPAASPPIATPPIAPRPGDKGKIIKRTAPPASPQRVTVKLQMGNNLITQ